MNEDQRRCRSHVDYIEFATDTSKGSVEKILLSQYANQILLLCWNVIHHFHSDRSTTQERHKAITVRVWLSQRRTRIGDESHISGPKFTWSVTISK